MSKAYVYLFDPCNGWLVAKIGMTTNLRQRLSSLRSRFECPDGKFLVIVPCKSARSARNLERRLHRYFNFAHFEDYMGSREWFDSELMAAESTLPRIFKFAVKRIAETWDQYSYRLERR